MADLANPIGQADECPIEVTAGDTEDFNVHLNNEDGSNAAVESWTATMVISDDKGGAGTGAGVNTYTGTAPGAGALGDIPIDMDLFDIPAGAYHYQIRTVDTITADAPAKTRFFGKFTVKARAV